MACNSPLNAWKGPKGIEFSPRTGYADLPVSFGCGRCMGCRIQKKRDWSIRAVHEAKEHYSTSFITLTYDDKSLPEDLGLHVEHWQNFAKKVRRDLGKFRFFGCGEYGDASKRPHWHALIYGQDWIHDRKFHKNRDGYDTFLSDTLAEAWPFGYHEIGEVTYASAQYVASYTTKKLGGDAAEKEYYRWDPITRSSWYVRPEIGLMSRRPGLGTSWLKKFWSDVYPADEVVVEGRKYPPPSFYDAWMKQNQPKVLEKVLKTRREKAMDTTDYKRMIARENRQRSMNNLYSGGKM